MIGLIQNKINYEYDIRSLLLAFRIDEKIELTELPVNSIYDFVIVVFYARQETKISFVKNQNILDEETVYGDYLDKVSFKNPLKRGLYHILSRQLKKELPWGTLTGIRPTKIALKTKEEDIKERFLQEYLVSEEKVKLCQDVVKREKELLGTISYQNGYSLYIGIPFCPTTCLYCSFTSYPIGQYKDMVDVYLDALMKEIHYVKQAYQHKELTNIYLGGGTPTTLTAKQLERLFDTLKQAFDFTKIKEITVEAGRPDSIDQEKLQVLYGAGVTRISINPQTMNDRTLQVIGRKHSVKQIIECFSLARTVGFDNINMDLILGLPGEDLSMLEHTMKEVEKLQPESVTIHSLALKRTAALRQLKDKYSFGATKEMLSYAHQKVYDMGMDPYYLYRQKNIPGNFENVGFSVKGKECLYNILIMEELHDIIAVGAGASSKILDSKHQNILRVENLKDIHQYIQRIDEMLLRKQNAINKATKEER